MGVTDRVGLLKQWVGLGRVKKIGSTFNSTAAYHRNIFGSAGTRPGPKGPDNNERGGLRERLGSLTPWAPRHFVQSGGTRWAFPQIPSWAPLHNYSVIILSHLIILFLRLVLKTCRQKSTSAP